MIKLYSVRDTLAYFVIVGDEGRKLNAVEIQQNLT
jgi:hypothetical protein